MRAYVRTCVERNRGVLPYVSTLSTVYDLDMLRAAVGDRRLSYLGFSYGTLIGATYASTFPTRYRALVLDGAVDFETWSARTIEGLREHTQGFEQALNRFFIACAANQTACLGFGGEDPEIAYDELLERLDVTPLPAPNASRPLPVTGDVARFATILTMYAKQFWPLLAQALAAAQAGDGSLLRELSDIALGINPDGTYSPGIDQYFVITGLEALDQGGIETYVRAGRHGFGLFDHFWINTGYSQLVELFLTVQPRERFRGPVRARPSAPTTLVVGTTYDPATPYVWSRRLTRDLGNARLLTMRGDGHTAYGGNSACIDAAVNAYLLEGTLPAAGTVCRQEVPFAQPEPEPEAAAQSTGRPLREVSPRVAPLAAREAR